MVVWGCRYISTNPESDAAMHLKLAPSFYRQSRFLLAIGHYVVRRPSMEIRSR
jgi:hypothetical protein